jgi:hypothetical protein
MMRDLTDFKVLEQFLEYRFTLKRSGGVYLVHGRNYQREG